MMRPFLITTETSQSDTFPPLIPTPVRGPQKPNPTMRQQQAKH